MVKTILITGANSGVGKEAARQLALLDSTEKIYLGARNEAKAIAAKRSLEEATGRAIFEIVMIDVTDLNSVRAAVESLDEPIEALVMNAGGMGGPTPGELTADGVTQLFAVNVLGHAVLLDEILEARKLTKVAIFAGSEAARGVPKMGMKRPALETSSVDEFASIADGSFFDGNVVAWSAYGPVKYMGAMWMSSVARQNPDLRFVTVSPGSTSGTAAPEELPPFMKFMMKNIGVKLMPILGLMQELELGAKRYVDVLNDESYKSGVFYGSKAPTVTGPMVDQGTIFADLKNETFQDNANEAIHRFIPVKEPTNSNELSESVSQVREPSLAY
jgi:NAD(P)-dependent dehydrogenase (short-subunit alcohol dehydrogenase family)